MVLIGTLHSPCENNENVVVNNRNTTIIYLFIIILRGGILYCLLIYARVCFFVVKYNIIIIRACAVIILPAYYNDAHRANLVVNHSDKSIRRDLYAATAVFAHRTFVLLTAVYEPCNVYYNTYAACVQVLITCAGRIMKRNVAVYSFTIHIERGKKE